MTTWLQLESDGRVLRADAAAGIDLSIPLEFDAPQPTFFAAPAATSRPYRVGSFAGSVAAGSSCNCASISLTPHCNGTHTECVGHVTLAPLSVRDVRIPSLLIARLVSVQPLSPAQLNESLAVTNAPTDRVIGRIQLESALPAGPCAAVILRTLPNSQEKRFRNYDAGSCPPYLSAAAAEFLVERGVEHLVIDLPSVDRANDDGQLAAHRIFWGLPPGATDAKLARRSHATITEMAFIDDSVADGEYLLNLQVAPFVADAAPSRPIIFRPE